MSTREIGAEYEQRAAEYLEKQGYVVLERNFRCRTGEIDIIAKDGKYLCFIEVKYRKTQRAGYAAEAVNWKKQHIISKTAAYYLIKNRLADNTPCRFDVLALNGEEIRLIKNAFEYCG